MSKFPCQQKVVSFKNAVELAKKLREEGKKIVVTTGVYDLFHIGHLYFLQDCAIHGDVLFVAIADDEMVKRTKGSSRPIIPQEQRAQIVAGAEGVSYVFISDNLLEKVCALKPHVWAMSSTSIPFYLERKKLWAKKYGIEVIEKGSLCEVHTTGIIEKINH